SPRSTDRRLAVEAREQEQTARVWRGAAAKCKLIVLTIVAQPDNGNGQYCRNDADGDPSALSAAVVLIVRVVRWRASCPWRFEDVTTGHFRIEETVVR